MGDTEQYAKYFSAGMRVGVGIPMQNNELFRDWAIINTIEEDVVDLQLSRDVLPSDVDMQTGKVLELRCGKEGKGYRCSGVYITDGEAGTIQLRLTGDVNSNELREYYRIDAFLPIKLEISQEHNLDAVLKEWRTRKQRHLEEELQRKEEVDKKRKELIFRTAEGEFDVVDDDKNTEPRPVPHHEEIDEMELLDPYWKEVNASALNLSAGGFKFITSDHYEIDDIVFQEVFVPSHPPRIMDSVARVVFKNRNYFVGNDKEYYNVATHFLFVDERDRDAIVSHISNLELMRIRLLRQNAVATEKFERSDIFTPFKMVCVVLLLLACLIVIAYYFHNYLSENIKNEIEETFESGIRKYLDRFK